MSHHDVVIVGAGMAGLACANQLHRAGRDVVLLKAGDVVGGRTAGVELDGEIVELGGQFIGPGQDRMYALAAELGMATFPTHNEGANLIETPAGRRRRFRGIVPRLGPLTLLDLAQTQARFERLARTVDPARPWTTARASTLDEETMASWIRRTMWTRAGRRFFTAACEAIWACEPAEISVLHALFYARAAGSLATVMAVEGGAQQDRVDGGTHGMATRLAARFGDAVRLRTLVHRIDRHPDGVTVTAEDGTAWSAGHVVVAIPPALAARIDYRPALPSARDNLLQRLPMGSVHKCVAVYPEPFWRRDGLTGGAVSLRGPLTLTVDSSPRDGGRGILIGFAEGSAARELATRSADDRRAAVLDAFGRLFGPSALRPSGFVERNWNEEPFSRGAYAAVFPPGAWTQLGPALREPTGRIHWAGTETSAEWYGYLEGAVRSGEAAAAAILA